MIISVDQLVKNYGKEPALGPLSFDVPQGEILGLIGADGSGKTTLLQILSTLLLPSSGNVRILGRDALRDYRRLRPEIGYMPARFSLYPDLTVAENLAFFASLYGISMAEGYAHISSLFAPLEPFRRRLAGRLSGGMKQKLSLSCVLIHHPKVLFLDEPTRGVDPFSRNDLWNILRELRAQGATMVISTTYMDEASFCDRIAILKDGKLLALDTPAGLRQAFRHPLLAIRSDQEKYQLIRDLEAFDQAGWVYPFGEFIHLTWKEGLPDRELIRSYLETRGHQDIEVNHIFPGTEDRFLELTKESAHEQGNDRNH